VLSGLVDKGNTVLVIEHNLDVIKTADWLIDMGPDGGSRGGTVVAEGTPEEVAAVEASHTGVFLKPILEGRGAEQPGAPRRAKAAAATSGPARKTTKTAAAKKAPVKKAAAKKAAATKTAARKAPAKRAAAKKK
jgi:excinuclease ABC subunit A